MWGRILKWNEWDQISGPKMLPDCLFYSHTRFITSFEWFFTLLETSYQIWFRDGMRRK